MAQKVKTVRSLADTPLELSHQVRDRSGSSGEMLSSRENQPRGPSQQSTDRFPPINNSNNAGDIVPWMNGQQVDNRATSRLEVLEGRLQQQERTTQSLLDRAFKIKEDIVDNLNMQHGTWQEEKQARALLQEHIRTITDVVRKLSGDIQTLEQQLLSKDTAISGTNSNVKNLELHHVAGVTDLRGRVARCDASISRLAADLKACYESVKSVSQQHADDHGKLSERLGHTDARVSDLYSHLDKQITEQTMQIKRLEGELSRQISSQDARTRSAIDELKGRITTEKQIAYSEREKLESRLVGSTERAFAIRDGKQLEYEKKTDETLRSHQNHISRLEEQLIKEREANAAAMQSLESRLSTILDGHVRKQNEEMKRLKSECREGFATVHESISNMKQVQDGKRKLLEEKMQKQIGEIRKMVVLI